MSQPIYEADLVVNKQILIMFNITLHSQKGPSLDD